MADINEADSQQMTEIKITIAGAPERREKVAWALTEILADALHNLGCPPNALVVTEVDHNVIRKQQRFGLD